MILNDGTDGKTRRILLEALEKEMEMEILEMEKEKERAKVELLQALIKEKDLRIKSTDSVVESLRVDLFRKDGLLTSRGVFEWLMKCVHAEMKTTKRFNATNTLNQLVNQYSNSERPSTPIAGEIYDAMLKCDCGSTLRNLYGELSQEIHGASWSGLGVKVYTEKFSAQNACFMKELVSIAKLPLQEEDVD